MIRQGFVMLQFKLSRLAPGQYSIPAWICRVSQVAFERLARIVFGDRAGLGVIRDFIQGPD